MAKKVKVVEKLEIRNRIVGHREMRAGDLVPDERNWRTHSDHQRTALTTAMTRIGDVDVVRVRPDPDNEGKFILIDGHLRADLDPDRMVRAIILDLNEEEALEMLATYDPIAGMADTDATSLSSLLGQIAQHDASEGFATLIEDVVDLTGVGEVVMPASGTDAEHVPDDGHRASAVKSEKRPKNNPNNNTKTITLGYENADFDEVVKLATDLGQKFELTTMSEIVLEALRRLA